MTKKVRGLLVVLACLAGLAVAAPAMADATFDVSAHTTFDRTYTWDVQKVARNPDLVLAKDQTYLETYDVIVTNTGYVDSNWKVQDGIHYYGTTFTPTAVSAVIDPGGIAASVVCPPGSLGSETSDLNCTYSASLPDGSPRTTTATVDLTAGSSVSQSFSFDFTTDLLPGQPVEYNKCVDVVDSYAGNLGTVCVGDAPKTFTYTRAIGPYRACGEFDVPNHAGLLVGGREIDGADANVHVTIHCETGCTRTIGYWKTHAGFGPQDDVVTQYLPKLLGTSGGAKTQTVSTAAKAVQYLEFRGSNNVKDASNGINKLYAQLLAAKLNIASGASGGSIASTIAAADAFLANNDSLSWAGLSKGAKAQVLGWMSTLDSYNNGLVGPPHCDE